MQTLTLRDGGTSLELLPAAGGAIGRYCTVADGRTYEWLCPGSVDRPAAFPMVPFCSRIKNGRFRFAGQPVQLLPNLPAEAHALHGQGWLSRWRVVEQEEHRAALEYRHQADAWPWNYLARQEFALSGDRLTVSLSICNASTTSMPAGLGLHPFFPRTDNARLQAIVGEVWQMDEQIMPIRRTRLPRELDLPSGVGVSERALDNVFADWDGRFNIDWPESRSRLRVRGTPEFGHLVVFTPPAQPYFCVEPASNVTDAFNMLARGETGHGARILEPDQILQGSIEFAPECG